MIDDNAILIECRTLVADGQGASALAKYWALACEREGPVRDYLVQHITVDESYEVLHIVHDLGWTLMTLGRMCDGCRDFRRHAATFDHGFSRYHCGECQGTFQNVEGRWRREPAPGPALNEWLT